MKANGERVSLADLLGIQVLRRLDQNEPKYCADIDAPLAADAPRDHRGHLKHPVRVLADRADRVLQTRHGVSAGWMGEVVGWLRVIRFLGYLLVLVFAFGLAEPLLKEGEVVNVEWIFGFLATLFISMAITSTLMILAIFAKRKDEDSPDRVHAGGATKSFAKLLIVHWLIQFVIRRAVPWIERRILKRTGDKSPEEIKRIETVTESLYDTLSQQSRRMALEAAATSNTVWFLLSIGVLMSLGKMGLFREYDFRWRATIVSEEFMRESTQALAVPIKGWPLVSQPTEADVRWLATGKLSDTAGDKTPEESHQDHRQLWGRLFLAYLLYYGVLPRFVLMVVSRWLAARGWKGLRPKLKDPYFKTIVENIETPPFESTLEEQSSEAGDQGPEVRGERGGVSPPVPLVAPINVEENQEADAPRSPIGSNTFVFSYDVKEPSEGWPKSLSMSANGSVINLGNASDRAARKQAQAELAERRDEVGLLVIVADLVDNPDGLFEHFVRETINHLHPQAGRSMVLIGGERLRNRYEGDAKKIADRIELWKHKGISAGIEREKIVEFDIEHATTAARDTAPRTDANFSAPCKTASKGLGGSAIGGVVPQGDFRGDHEPHPRRHGQQIRRGSSRNDFGNPQATSRALPKASLGLGESLRQRQDRHRPHSLGGFGDRPSYPSSARPIGNFLADDRHRWTVHQRTQRQMGRGRRLGVRDGQRSDGSDGGPRIVARTDSRRRDGGASGRVGGSAFGSCPASGGETFLPTAQREGRNRRTRGRFARSGILLG